MPRKKKTESAPKTPTSAAERTKDGSPRKGGGLRPDAERIAQVEKMVVMQFGSNEIVRQLSKPIEQGGYGVSERTIRDDLRRVYADLADDREEERDARRNAALSTARAMFRKAIAQGDLKVADKFFDKVCRILGAYAPDAVKVASVDLEALGSLSDQDLDDEIAREVKKLLAALPPEKRAAILNSKGKE